MKKNPIIFIAMLIALAFTSCQMNTDDSVVTPPAPTTEATYTITVTGDQTNGTVTLSKTEAKAGETVKITIEPKSGYKFETKINGSDMGYNGSEKKSYEVTMPASNVTITVEFVKITDGGSPTTPTTPTTDGGEDNNGETPATANEYTVSVASGIKGGHIEVSLDNATWTTLSTSTKYAKNTKLYVRAVADKHYEYKDGLRTDGLEGQLKYIMLNSNAELTANFVIKNESLTPGSLTFNGKKANLSNYRRLVRIDIDKSSFSGSYENARLAFGFSDGFYGINKRIGSTSTDKYFYVYDTVIPYETFELKNDQLYRIFVAINLDNSYELPDGEIYVLFPNLKNSEGKSVMYKAEKDNDGVYVVDLTVFYPKYYFDASQL